MSVMIAFRVSEELKARMEEEAKREGLTLTAWLIRAAERELDEVEFTRMGRAEAARMAPILAKAVATQSETKAEARSVMDQAFAGTLEMPEPDAEEKVTFPVQSLARMEREETQRNCRHPLNRRIGKACPVCGKDPV